MATDAGVLFFLAGSEFVGGFGDHRHLLEEEDGFIRRREDKRDGKCMDRVLAQLAGSHRLVLGVQPHVHPNKNFAPWCLVGRAVGAPMASRHPELAS